MITVTRNTLRRWLPLLVAGAIAWLPQVAASQDYPSKPVKYVVPFPPGGLTDVMGGQIDRIVSNSPESLPHVKGGKLPALAVTSKARHPLLPDVPTVAEVGCPLLGITHWTGIMVPAATPATIVARINADANAVLAEAEMKHRIINQGFEPVAMTPVEARAFFDAETARWGKLVREAGIEPD